MLNMNMYVVELWSLFLVKVWIHETDYLLVVVHAAAHRLPEICKICCNRSVFWFYVNECDRYVVVVSFKTQEIFWLD